MLFMKPIEDAAAAISYHEKSDGGYYYDRTHGLRREWGGKAAEKLGLSGEPDFEQFKRLVHGLDPHTGKQLTARLNDDRLPGCDMTASVPKGVTTALERGDTRIQDVIWAAGREALADLEQYVSTRVRKGGKQEDRLTGNLVYYATEHAETRPTKEDHFPDWDRHIHFFVFNLTHDGVEDKWKAVKFRHLIDRRKFFSHRFDARMSHKLAAELGYEIETKWNPDGSYYSWDIAGIPQSVTDKNSRRHGEINESEQAILAKRQEAARAAGEDGNQPERVSKAMRDKLARSSRLGKRKDLTLEDCRDYWNERITPEEGAAIAETIRRAKEGGNAPPPSLGDAVEFGMRHHFQGAAVVPAEELEITILERAMGSSSPPEAIAAEFQKRGGFTGLVDGIKMASTKAMQDLESEVTGFVRDARGTCRPLVPGEHQFQRAYLNEGQRAAVNHILQSRDRVVGVRGKSGTGKTTSLQEAAEAIEATGKRVIALAPTAKAVDVLLADKFEAYTVAKLLDNPKLQVAIKGNVLFIDEAGLLNLRDAQAVLKLATRADARVVLVGDSFQHSAVGPDSLKLLERYSGLKTVEITENMRQKDAAHKAAVASLARHDVADGLARLDEAGAVREIADAKERYAELAATYLEKRAEGLSVGVISPTRREGEIVTGAIRQARRDAGELGTEEREFGRLVSYELSEAARGEGRRYRPDDVVVFHQNAKGGFKRGSKATVIGPGDDASVLVRNASGETARLHLRDAKHFDLFRQETIRLSEGDAIRFTKNGYTSDKKALRNGTVRTIKEFTSRGDFVLDNGFVVAKDYGHVSYGYVSTSIASQGSTFGWTLIAEDSASGRAASSEQLYVSSSRAKEGITIFTNDKAALLEATKRSSAKLTATEFAGLAGERAAERPRRVREQIERIIRLGNAARGYAAQKLDDIRHEMGRMQERLGHRGTERREREASYGR